MLSIHMICVGKLKESFYREAAAEYVKRLGRYCRLQVTELTEERLPQDPSPAQISAALAREGEAIRAKLPRGALTAAMCVEGKGYSSPDFAALLERAEGSGSKGMAFLIGGSFGLDERLKEEAEVRISMSEMTFPHHLARVMLLEQIYRGFKILEGSRYHK